jgi:hypothetical protein
VSEREQPHDEMTAHASTDEPGGVDRADTYDLTDSDVGTSSGTGGGMGVSSEREGPTGPGQHGTTGVRDVGPVEREPGAAVPPEQAPGAPETNPDGLAPKGGYPDTDPRSSGDEPDDPRADRGVDRRPDES